MGATTTRVGVAAHVCTDEQFETLRDAGAPDSSIVRGAAEAILFERARAMALAEPPPEPNVG